MNTQPRFLLFHAEKTAGPQIIYLHYFRFSPYSLKLYAERTRFSK